MAIRRTVVTATGATGGAGTATATANTTTPVDGEIMGVHLAYLDAPPAATCDVTLVEAGVSPAQTILSISNAATDGWFYPMQQAKNTAGTDISGMGREIYVSANLTLTIAQANNADGVTATILWDDGS
jgi:hypothetical protein